MTNRLTWRQWAGGVLTFVGIGLTATLGFVASANKPPSQASQVLIGLLATAAQLGAVTLFAQNGRPSPELVQTSTRNLLQLLAQLSSLKGEVETVMRRRRIASEGELRHQLGRVSLALETATSRAGDAVSNWRQVQPNAVEKAENDLNQDGLNG